MSNQNPISYLKFSMPVRQITGGQFPLNEGTDLNQMIKAYLQKTLINEDLSCQFSALFSVGVDQNLNPNEFKENPPEAKYINMGQTPYTVDFSDEQVFVYMFHVHQGVLSEISGKSYTTILFAEQ